MCVLDAAPALGGQASTADWIENYPGFPGGIQGDRLMQRFMAQSHAQQVVAVRRRVAGVRVGSATGGQGVRWLGVELEGGELLQARAVILASGATPRDLPLKLPRAAPVFHRSDALPQVRGARVLVIGGGEAALDQALRCCRLGAARVAVALRGLRPRAMALLVARACDAGVELWPATILTAVTRGERGWQAHLEPGGALAVDAVLVCVGRQPNLLALPEEVALDRSGLPRVDRLGRTSVAGIYLAGDVCRGRHRQGAIAVGDGVAAAMDAVQYLETGIWEEAT